MKYMAEGYQVQKSWDRTRFDLRKWSRERGKEDSGRVYCSWSITGASHRGTCKDFSFSSEWGESCHRLMKRKMTRPRNQRMETLQWRKVTCGVAGKRAGSGGKRRVDWGGWEHRGEGSQGPVDSEVGRIEVGGCLGDPGLQGWGSAQRLRGEGRMDCPVELGSGQRLW